MSAFTACNFFSYVAFIVGARDDTTLRNCSSSTLGAASSKSVRFCATWSEFGTGAAPGAEALAAVEGEPDATVEGDEEEGEDNGGVELVVAEVFGTGVWFGTDIA